MLLKFLEIQQIDLNNYNSSYFNSLNYKGKLLKKCPHAIFSSPLLLRINIQNCFSFNPNIS